MGEPEWMARPWKELLAAGAAAAEPTRARAKVAAEVDFILMVKGLGYLE
jgi:hypothetical protein